MLPQIPSLSRTSSTTSISSSDDLATVTPNSTASRRTRKRFTNAQLTILENLFHQNSHPSREEREAVAKAGGMEIKSVTIWFQNKRQTERKVALNNATNSIPNHVHRSNAHPPSSSPYTSSAASVHAFSSPNSRPSLDRVASRSELQVATPRTPTRRHDPNASIWDNMPSSPLAPPASPPPREYVEFGKTQRTRRTLEWACAAARLAGKGNEDNSRPPDDRDPLDWTDEETDEAITPPSTWGKGDARWTLQPYDRTTLEGKGVQDDDMMRAALALCGLGRRSG